jgi:hypothetical protein
MIRALVDHVGPGLVAVSLAAALISTAKWLLDLRVADATPETEKVPDLEVEALEKTGPVADATPEPDPNPVGEIPQHPDEGEAA